MITSVLQYLPQILILLSLGVIIYLFGKKMPKLRELSRSSQFTKQDKISRPNIFKRFLAAVGRVAKGVFVWLAEGLVKRSKKILHLIHFWLIKVKKGKKENEMISEIEAKQELIMEEEKSLDKVINEDLAQAEVKEIEFFHEEENKKVSLKEERVINRNHQPQALIDEPEQPMVDKDKKIEQFFTQEQEVSEETEQEAAVEESPAPKKKGFFSRWWKKEEPQEQWKEEIYNYPAENLPEGGFLADEYADGIVKKGEVTEGIVQIERKPIANDERLIKEVRTIPRKTEEADPDEELGIDRRILEKKIIQKITKSPRDVENYRQLGELYIKMKEYSDAEESYKQILKITPRDMDAKRKLEKIKLLKRLS